jgi:putative PIG3 family NAD(P)H quinone oxidoreductase
MTQIIGKNMRAIAIKKPGGPEVLQPETLSVPRPRNREVLVSVVAAGVNRPDVLQRQGKYPVPADASPLPGLEMAGQVVALGDGVSRWQAGDKVMALTHGGAYAEYCCVHEDHCLAVPDSLTLVEAAAVPETYFTVWYNVFMRAKLAAGESILIHGGSSGIGTTAIQLAKSRHATVITTAGSDDKCEFCSSIGADHAINYRTREWESVVLELTASRGVDVVLDMVAGPYMQKNINVLGRDGRYVIIAFLQGTTAELNMRRVSGMRLTITGSTLRPQTTAEKSVIAAELASQVWPLLESGQVKPIIHATFPLHRAADAHALMESSRHMGKIVLTT